jgi:hypothetical protein
MATVIGYDEELDRTHIIHVDVVRNKEDAFLHILRAVYVDMGLFSEDAAAAMTKADLNQYDQNHIFLIGVFQDKVIPLMLP